MLLVKRANETAKTVLSEASILGMIYDAISKDPRDELRMLGSNSSFIGQSLEEFITTLHKSTHTGPFNPRNVKMNEFKPKTIQYCNHFQEGKCRFGDKCRYEHKINPDYKKKEIEYDEKKKSNYIIPNKNNNKIQYKKKNSTQQNNNNKNNNSQNRDDNIEGKPPRYSNQRQLPIKNMKIDNINSDENVSCDNNSSWLFNKPSGTGSADINPRMYVLKRCFSTSCKCVTNRFHII